MTETTDTQEQEAKRIVQKDDLTDSRWGWILGKLLGSLKWDIVTKPPQQKELEAQPYKEPGEFDELADHLEETAEEIRESSDKVMKVRKEKEIFHRLRSRKWMRTPKVGGISVTRLLIGASLVVAFATGFMLG